MRITATDPATGKNWYVFPTMKIVRRWDNGALISCGWTIGKDLPKPTFARMRKVEISAEEYKHSSCQSYCIRRGHARCSW
jgi:hypothetical protein